MNRVVVVIAILVAVGAIAFAYLRPARGPKSVPGAGGGLPVVYTTFYPTEYWAERLGRGFVDVHCPVPEDEDPIFWEPTPAEIAAFQKADLIIVNGASFEKWIAQATLPTGRVVDTALPFASEFITFEKATTHSHGPKGEHTHAGIDGHTWLDPNLAKIQAGEVLAALARLVPQHADELRARHQALVKDLDDLDRALRSLAPRTPGQWLLASHPAYNYLARRYDWKIANLDLDPEQMPDEAALTQIGAVLAQQSARAIIWESAPDPEIADRLRERFDLESFVVSPCELLGAMERKAGVDYIGVMKTNVDALRAAFAL
ncbi:MAG: metal ABC transporter substrate-binding protein [Planctomycetota bacterium]